MTKDMKKISVAFPVYNEEASLTTLYQKVKQACLDSDVDYELIFVDNGSTDGSLGIIKELQKDDKRVVYVSLSRNFGHQGGLFCGMSYATGDAIITMDADLQHPPAVIPQMIELWKKGAEVVFTTKKSSRLSLVKHLITKAFYWFISRVSGVQLSFGQSDFRLLDKKALRAILAIPEYHKFLRGQVKWIGFNQQGLVYDVESRFAGQSKFSYRDLFLFALDGIFAFSRNPLRLLTLSGFLVGALSFLYMFFVLTVWFLKTFEIIQYGTIPPGWVMLILSVSFLGSLQLIALGILGEYIGRIYDQGKGRPIFIVRESSADRE